MGLLDGLDDAQRHAVTVDVPRLAVVAGAGSGKTRVLTRRVAHRVESGSADPARILVLTFTRRAATELVFRLSALGLRDRVAAATFHAAALAELRRHRADRGRGEPILLTRRTRLLAPLLAPLGRSAPTPAAVGREIEWAKASGVDPAAYPDVARATGRPLASRADVVADVFSRYEAVRRRRGLVDFDDLLLDLTHALEDDPGWAAARHWWWRHLLVDEYQDVTPVQLRLLQAWTGPEGDLCVVGDDAQSIYGFAGAQAGMLARVTDDFPGTTVVQLPTNHRSTTTIVEAAAAVLGTPSPAAPAGPGPAPTLAEHTDDREEAQAIAAALRRHRAHGHEWSDMAVLVRTNAQIPRLAEALAASGIPHRTPVRGPLDRPGVREVLDDLRARQTTARGTALAASLADLALDPPASSDRGGLDDVLAAAGEYLALERGRPTVDGLELHLTTSRGDLDHRSGPAVTITTFHRAKGLEWDIVHLSGLDDGLVPMGGAPVDEEARLLHVAITRARLAVHLSWALQRGDRFGPGGPSPLLEPLRPMLVDPLLAEAAPDHAGRAAALAQARAELAAHRPRAAAASRRGGRLVRPRSPLDPEARQAVDRLRRWRSTAARAAGVPPDAVLPDAVLVALATSHPASVDDVVATCAAAVGTVAAARWGPACWDVLAPADCS